MNTYCTYVKMRTYLERLYRLIFTAYTLQSNTFLTYHELLILAILLKKYDLPINRRYMIISHCERRFIVIYTKHIYNSSYYYILEQDNHKNFTYLYRYAMSYGIIISCYNNQLIIVLSIAKRYNELAVILKTNLKWNFIIQFNN